VAASTFEKAFLTFNYTDITLGSAGTETVELDGNPVTGPAAVPLVSRPPANPTVNGAATVSNGAVAASAYSLTLNSILDSGNGAVPNNGTLRPSSEGFATTGGTCKANTSLGTGSSCNLSFSFTNPPDATGPEPLSLTYNFTDNNGYSWSVLAPLQGNPGVASAVKVSPNPLVFTPSPPTGSQTLQISITNNNSSSITLNAPVFPPAANFNLTAAFSGAAGGTCTFSGSPSTASIPGNGGSCTLSITFTDPVTAYGPLTSQPAIGPQKNTLLLGFSDGSFVTETLRGNPGPMSGALLTIDTPSSNSTTPIHVAVYDSQIHNGLVQAVSATGPCTATDAMFPTDAYVFQGASWTGCDGDEVLTSIPDASTNLVSAAGALVPYNFTVSTHYQCGPLFQGQCNAPTKCASPDTTLTVNGIPQIPICSYDSGFVTVTNNGSDFTGTIQLAGQSTECGTITDSIGNLTSGNSVTLALAPDSSFCGGFEAQQTKSIAVGSTTKFPFGNDDYQVTPFNSNAGDAVTLMVVPYPDNSASDNNSSVAVFNPGPNFPGYRCTPWSDLSAPTGSNPVCGGLQIGCVPGNGTVSGGNPTGDCETYIYSSKLDYVLAPDTAQNGSGTISGPGFLGVHHQNFPPPCTGSSDCFNLNTLVSYDGDCCVKLTGGSGGSAHIDVWNPNAPQILTVNTFTGFQSPINDLPAVNTVRSGQALALKWIQDDTTGQPITNLILCANTNCPSGGTNPPWINVTAYGVTCPGSTQVPINSLPTGNSGLQNFSGTTPGLYQYNWDTPTGLSGTCAQVVFTYNTGATFVTPALFQFK
jgi:hypothetical protein